MGEHESKKIHSESFVFQMRVEGSLKSGLIIFKYTSHLTGLCHLRKGFLESPSPSSQEARGRAFLPQLQALRCPQYPSMHIVNQMHARGSVIGPVPSSIQGLTHLYSSAPVSQ